MRDVTFDSKLNPFINGCREVEGMAGEGREVASLHVIIVGSRWFDDPLPNKPHAQCRNHLWKQQ